MDVTRTQAIKAFLEAKTHEDLSGLYNHDMECQVNVAQDGGERIESEYKGRQWHGWTDGVQTWKSFRIPYKANSEPEYEDRRMAFDLSAHAEGIGMTGWDWKSRVSRWVAFDFDAIMGHSDKHNQKLTQQELYEVKEAACAIPWVTVRLSTSGKGLHLYVFLDEVETANHTEHAALARSILGLMSAEAGYDFESRVDVCGGNMWVWHRKMTGTDGLTLVKQGDVLYDIPQNWRDHLQVIKGRRRKALPGWLESDSESVSQFEELTGQRPRVKLDDEHKKLLRWLQDNGASFWWDQDNHMLVCHTYDLKQCHTELGFRGVFETISTGRGRPDHNCFAFPMRRGGWSVRRYTQGTAEASTWDQDTSGYTRCYYNREPDLKSACHASGGIENTQNGFVFTDSESAQKAALALGADLKIPTHVLGRETLLKQHKDGRLVVQIDRKEGDPKLEGWLPDRGKKWTRIFNVKNSGPAEIEVGNYDDLVRHVVSSSGSDCGWLLRTETGWNEEPLTHVRAALEAVGLKAAEAKNVIGNSVVKPWILVNLPFQPEYPGDRRWNRESAQFAFLPNLDKEKRTFPTWMKILNHIGKNLTDAVLESEWCKKNGLKTGADYLKCWCASLFQQPFKQLPYLFLWGDQNCGKSILHEALGLLVTSGVKRADQALKSDRGFNGELEHAILCVVEEIDLNANKTAYNAIKDFVTALQISIHIKGQTPFMVPNTTHWIQCANYPNAVPVFDGDTRITMIHVEEIEESIPKDQLMEMLRKEAPDFLAELIKLELPKTNDRLNIPILNTADKVQISKSNQTLLEQFIEQECFHIPGAITSIAEFTQAFHKWLDPNERYNWSKHKISKNMPPKFPKGRNRRTAAHSYGNLSLTNDFVPGTKLIMHNGFLFEEGKA